jgi:hypothetical protein
MSFASFKYWLGGTIKLGPLQIGAWPLVWLKPKVYRTRSYGTHLPLGPLRFIWRGTNETE